MTNAQIAEETSLSPASTLERVKKLEKAGIIDRYVALVEPETLGLKTTAFVSISLAKHTNEEVSRFRDAVSHMPEVLECYHITGDDDYLLKILVADIKAYEDFILNRLTTIPNVGKIRTSITLSTVKRETAVPIPESVQS